MTQSYMFYFYNLMILLGVAYGIYLIAGKNKTIKFNIFTVYYAIIFGMLIEYVNHRNLLLAILISAILAMIGIVVGKSFNHCKKYIAIWVLAFQYCYVITRAILNLLGINFDKYSEIEILPTEYQTIEWTLRLSCVISVLILMAYIIISSLVKKKLFSADIICKLFGSYGIVGVCATTKGDMQMSGEWQDYFLPLFKIEYAERTVLFAGIIIVISILIVVWNIVIKHKKVSPEELERINEIYGINLTKEFCENIDYKIFDDKRFYRWTDFSEENINEIKCMLKYPYDVIRENIDDIEWNEHWGIEPLNKEEREKAIIKKMENAPKVIPIYSHRYVPLVDINPVPVLSIHGIDIIVFAGDIADYAKAEFGKGGSDNKEIDLNRISIPFWEDLM